MTTNRRWSYLYLLAVLLGFLALTMLLHMPHDVEHWSGDFVISQFSKREKAQHPKIVLVYITGETLTNYPYLSPIDRGLLADLIQAADQAGAAVIGLDVILDRYTETQKDDKLKDVISQTKARLVLGAIDTSGPGERVQSSFLLARADGKGPASGHLYLDEHHHAPMAVSDHVVRSMAKRPGEDARNGKAYLGESFAEVLAHAAGKDLPPRNWLGEWLLPRSRHIDWLLTPRNGADTFMTLQAEDILGLGRPKLPAGPLLKDKAVLIGGNFDDRDQHLTPLSASRDDFSSGLFVHAQILAQLMEPRFIYEINPWIVAFITIGAAIAGYRTGRRAGHSYLWLELGSVAALVAIWVLAFWIFRIIFPYNMVLIAWLAGAAAGHYGPPESHSAIPSKAETEKAA